MKRFLLRRMMKHVTVGIFHDDTLGRELGKKGTESDLVMYNKKTDECIYTFMSPVENKLTVKTQILSSIDVAIVNCERMTAEVGETILLLDSLGITEGICVVPLYSDTELLRKMIRNTSLERFTIMERNIPKITAYLEKINPVRDISSPAIVIIDHSFSVKGIGEVILGFVKQGTIYTHDVMHLIPVNKDVLIRSIQMQDKNFDSATAGSRVGLAVKGAKIDELKRGTIFSADGIAKTDSRFTLQFAENRFYQGIKKGMFHGTIGMQSLPIMIKDIAEKTITIETERPVGYTKKDQFILLDLNAQKLHHIGTGKVI
jgi:selenocysteine-specific translation elongation factor